MKINVTESIFIDQFQKLRPNNFSVEGLKCLFEYLTDAEKDQKQEMELDVIGLCCQFSEMTAKEVIEQYGNDLKFIDENYIVCSIDGTILTEIDIYDPYHLKYRFIVSD